MNFKEAIDLLNEKHPGWQDKIDVNRLDQSHPNACILGQLYGKYTDGLAKLGVKMGRLTPFSGGDLRTQKWKDYLMEYCAGKESAPKPHKWADVIKAWADGQEVQYRLKSSRGPYWSTWDTKTIPSFNDNGLEWRVKPKTVKKWHWLIKETPRTLTASSARYTEDSAKAFFGERLVRPILETEIEHNED